MVTILLGAAVPPPPPPPDTVSHDRIIEGNSNVDIFDDNSTSRAVFKLDGAEKFRINEGGQIGLAGANYGTDGQVLTSQGSGAAAQWETIPIEVANDTTPQLGGNLASNGNSIRFADGDRAFFGTGSDLQIFHNGTNSFITDSGTGDLYFRGDNSFIVQSSTGENKYPIHVVM